MDINTSAPPYFVGKVVMRVGWKLLICLSGLFLTGGDTKLAAEDGDPWVEKLLFSAGRVKSTQVFPAVEKSSHLMAPFTFLQG